MLCPGIDLLIIINAWYLLSYLISVLMNVVNFGNFSTIITQNFFWQVPYFFPYVFQIVTFYTSWDYPRDLRRSIPIGFARVLFFCSHSILVRGVRWHSFKVTDSPELLQSAVSPSKTWLVSVGCFWALSFPFGSFSEFLSLCFHFPSVLTTCLLFPLELLTY